jgi:hypothetical protein
MSTASTNETDAPGHDVFSTHFSSSRNPAATSPVATPMPTTSSQNRHE